MDKEVVQEVVIEEVGEIPGIHFDVSFVQDASYHPPSVQESPDTIRVSPTPVKKEKSAKAPNRDKPKLVDALGYVYNVKRVRGQGITDWQCTVRGRTLACRATVKQKHGAFIPGPQPHLHMAVSQLDQMEETSSKTCKSKKLKMSTKMPRAVMAAMKAEIHDGTKQKGKKSSRKQHTVRYGKPTLVDKRGGFTYVIKRVKGDFTDWQCCLRRGSLKCPATLKQSGGEFIFGPKPHCHEGGVNPEVPKVTVRISELGRRAVSEQTLDIVDAGNGLHGGTPTCTDSQSQLPELSTEALADGFCLMQSSSQRRRPRLIDNQGYTYNIKRMRGKARDWQCTVRNRKLRCPASLKECDGVFTPGPHSHIHAPEPGAVIKSVVTAKVKAKALTNLLQPTADIVNEVLTQQMVEEPTVAILKPVNLARMASRVREMSKKKYFNNLLCGIAEFQPDGAGNIGEDTDDSDVDIDNNDEQ